MIDRTQLAPDRINYSFGMKVSLGNYQSASFLISYTSDVKDTETKEDTLKRIIKFVESEADKKRGELGVKDGD